MEDLDLLPSPTVPPPADPSDERRGHQALVHDHIMTTYKGGKKSTLIVSGEGTGKTRMMLNAIHSI